MTVSFALRLVSKLDHLVLVDDLFIAEADAEGLSRLAELSVAVSALNPFVQFKGAVGLHTNWRQHLEVFGAIRLGEVNCAVEEAESCVEPLEVQRGSKPQMLDHRSAERVQ